LRAFRIAKATHAPKEVPLRDVALAFSLDAFLYASEGETNPNPVHVFERGVIARLAGENSRSLNNVQKLKSKA